MSAKLDILLDLLDLEPIEQNIYRGNNRDIGSGRVFGGQALAQALIAARHTVADGREAHSLHGYFILPGDVARPIVYFVDPLRDGKSFTTRQVTGIQYGHAIFSMAASFQVPEKGVEHQFTIPDVPPPESLADDLELIRSRADRIPEPVRAVYTQDRPIEFRPVDPVDPFEPDARDAKRYMWFRAIDRLSDEPVLHQAVLAYASDYGLLATALLPHRLTLQNPLLQAATLDHAIWFHRPFRVDDWLLYAMDAPVAAGGRGFTRGSVFTRAGELVASIAQEGLIRVHEAPKR